MDSRRNVAMTTPPWGAGERPGPSASAGPQSPRDAPRVPERINPLVLGTFCLMVMSFYFELPNRSFAWEVPTMTAAVFLLSALLAPWTSFGRVPGTLPWLAGFLLAYLVSATIHPWSSVNEFFHFFVLLVQALLVFWASFNLLSHEQAAITVLWWFGIAGLVRAALPMIGVGRTAYTVWTGGERVSAFGQNANFSAFLMSLGLVTLIGLTYGRRGRPLWMRLLVLPLAAVFGVGIVETGSRGGLLALVGGLAAFLFSPGERLQARIRNAVATLLAIGVLGYTALHTDVMRNRLEATAETGTLAGREQLFPSLVDMFLEKPALGWGPINYQYEVAVRGTDLARYSRDAHNLLLELLTAGGLVATVPFLIAFAWCGIAAWRGRATPLGMVSFALFAVCLVANLSTNLIAYKPFYFVLALAAASSHRARESQTCAG